MHMWLGFCVAGAGALGNYRGHTKAFHQPHHQRALVSVVLLGDGRSLVCGGVRCASGQLGVGPLVVVCSMAGGALNGLGAWTSFRALESGGKASIVISLVSLYPLLTVLLAVLAAWRTAHRDADAAR